MYFYFLYNFFTLNFTNLALFITGGNLINTVFFYINSFGFKSLLVVFFMFVFIFLLNFLILSISITKNKETKRKLKALFSKFNINLKISFLETIVYLLFIFIFILLLSYVNIITFILLIFLLIFFFIVTIIFNIAVIIIGSRESNLIKALNISWEFLKSNFWRIVLFVILVQITMSIFYFLIDNLYYYFFVYDVLIGLIFIAFYYVVYLFYFVNSFTIFVNKYI
jgi:hypothetical protein